LVVYCVPLDVGRLEDDDSVPANLDSDGDGEVPRQFEQPISSVIEWAANERVWLIADCLLLNVSGPAQDRKHSQVPRTLRVGVKPKLI
jgi:hypothetical protein